ncbi:hypothetical protein [uncultured Pseudokineococcus sp.]|uniref:hypothetical protein n=1 Tax=uncultured Pseudokineococcus sp. TaxID=1642928 RepID=UPI00260B8B52|nr:hypothetical protein [uncultured Pseudokineococcus sp.]
MPTWVSVGALVVTLVVLGSHAFFVLGLMDAGVTWTDGEGAYGVAGRDLPDALPQGVAHVLMVVMVLAVPFGPFAVLASAAAALASLRASRGARDAVDALAVSTVVLALMLLVLLITWGDELWIWILD